MSSAMFKLDDDDALFAAVPMPDFNADDEGLANPAVTGALSYGADSAASTVPKQHQEASWQPDDTISPVAQSTQLPARHQHQHHQTPRPKSSSHRRSSAAKFPGPAGRLPRLPSGNSGMANAFAAAARQLTASAAAAAASRREERTAARAAAAPEAVVATSSQTSTTSNASSSSGLDEEASWSAAAADLGPGLCRYLSRYSVAEALRLAASGQLPRNKVPAMLVIVETMDPSSVECVASVKDSTGQLQASLHRQVIRDLRDRVRPGAALVLRRVTLFSPDQRSYYLNITMDNIVRVYDRSGIPVPPSIATVSSSVASSTSPTPAMLNDEEVHRLEAECLRPKTPPVAIQPGGHQQATPKRGSDSRFDAAPSSAAAAADSSSGYGATSAKRFRIGPVGESGRPQQEPQQRHSYPQHPQLHQSRPQHPQLHQSRTQHPQPHQSRHQHPQPHQSRHQHPQSHQSRPQHPQPHQSHPQSRHSHPPQPHHQHHHQQPSRSRQSDTRVLQESYREAFEDNMDQLLASALDDI